MSIDVVVFDADQEDAWDQFCSNSINSTFQHSRLFLNYHKNRFRDASVLLLEEGKLVGVFPAAIKPDDDLVVVSHPGATYGGIIHQGRLLGKRMIDAIASLSKHYAQCGYRRLQYKVVPHIYTSVPAQDDIYALYSLGASLVRCDLSCCIDLRNRRKPSTRRKRGLKKALGLVSLSDDINKLDELWSVTAQNLSRKHDASPVHSIDELLQLNKCFPDRIHLSAAVINNHVEAGVIFFSTPSVWHAQYIASSETGYDTSALDAVFDHAISRAQQGGVRYFDFGTSNEEQGRVLNAGLYQFKSEFGGGGLAHEYYEMTL